jgi:F0F1-type ATP synthase membrane subunit b/b'
VIPDATSLVVIALLLICVSVVNTLIFKPILQVSEGRARAVRDRTLGAARAEVYRQMDDARRAALDTRATVLADTKREAESAIADATSRLSTQATAARAALEREATTLAGEIVTRVLGRTA